MTEHLTYSQKQKLQTELLALRESATELRDLLTKNELAQSDIVRVLEAPFIAEYSDKSFAVLGDSRAYRDQFKTFKGRFSRNIVHEGSEVVGWLIPVEHQEEVSDLLTTPVPTKEKPSQAPPHIVEYSDKSIAVLGNSREIKELLKGAGGRFNSRLTYDGKKCSGWIFSLKQRSEVEKILG